MMEPVVTIVCTAYNHGKYIRKTLDGFVNQKTDYKYKVIVHDDASTDDTANIIKEYEEKYPKIIIPIYQKENQYSKNIDFRVKYIVPLIDTDYVALCEGDDYWCDENKLQMQLDYMLNNPNCSMCVHDSYIMDEAGAIDGVCVNGSRKNKILKSREVIRAGGGMLFQTSSYVCKRHIYCDRPEELRVKGVGDYPMTVDAALTGDIYYFGKPMSCYRIGAVNSWTTKIMSNKEKMIVHYAALMQSLKRMNEYSSSKYKKEFDELSVQYELSILLCQKKYMKIILSRNMLVAFGKKSVKKISKEIAKKKMKLQYFMGRKRKIA